MSFLLQTKRRKKIMTKVSTADLYEACYYLLNSCMLEAIEGLPVNGEISCSLSFTGEKIPDLQAQYFQKTASVNLFHFRRAYSQVNSYLLQAKKKLKQDYRQQQQQKLPSLQL
jgi:hypothetical protein